MSNTYLFFTNNLLTYPFSVTGILWSLDYAVRTASTRPMAQVCSLPTGNCNTPAKATLSRLNLILSLGILPLLRDKSFQLQPINPFIFWRSLYRTPNTRCDHTAKLSIDLFGPSTIRTLHRFVLIDPYVDLKSNKPSQRCRKQRLVTLVHFIDHAYDCDPPVAPVASSSLTFASSGVASP